MALLADVALAPPPPPPVASAASAATPANKTVMPPTVIRAGVTLGVAPAPDAPAGAVRAAVAAAIAAHIDGLGLGVPLVWSRLIQVAYAATPLVVGVDEVRIDGAVRDIVPGPGAVVKPGAVVVS